MCVTNTLKHRLAPISFPEFSVNALQEQISNATTTAKEEPANPPKRRKRRRRLQKPGLTAKLNERHFVVHNYHDHSCDADDTPCRQEQQPQPQPPQQAAHNRNVPFPEKLQAVLEQVQNDGLDHIVSWQPHGRCFVIHKPKLFVQNIMPIYFNQSKLTSFQRQLNLYGFQRITSGLDAGGYYHEYFLRYRVYLCKHLIRTKVKGTKYKAASNPDGEPNFYNMPFVTREQQQQVTPRRTLTPYDGVTATTSTMQPVLTKSSSTSPPPSPQVTAVASAARTERSPVFAPQSVPTLPSSSSSIVPLSFPSSYCNQQQQQTDDSDQQQLQSVVSDHSDNEEDDLLYNMSTDIVYESNTPMKRQNSYDSFNAADDIAMKWLIDDGGDEANDELDSMLLSALLE